MAEDEVVRFHHQLNEHEFEQTPRDSEGQGSLVCCSPWGRKESDMTERLHFHYSLSCIGEGNGNPLQCSCLENRMDGGAWWATVHGVEKSLTRLKQLSMHAPCFDTDLCCSPCSFLLKQWKHWWMMLETPSLHLIQTAVPFVTVHSPPDVKSRLTGKDLHAGKD